MANPLQQRRRSAPNPRDHARRGGVGAPHRLRQCRKSSAGAVICPSPRNECPAGHWSQPFPIVQATSHRRPDPFSAWRRRRIVGCVLLPPRARAPVTGSRRSCHVSARENRLACDRGERRHLPGRDADRRSVSRAANSQARTCKRIESRILLGGRSPG